MYYVHLTEKLGLQWHMVDNDAGHLDICVLEGEIVRTGILCFCMVAF